MIPATQHMVSLFGASLAQASGQSQGVASATATGAGVGMTTIMGPSSTGLQSSGSSFSVGAQGSAPFADLMSDAIGQVDQLETRARTSVEGLMAGTGVDVHEAMIATEKAEMGFELVLSVRNKALAAYQQVMGMQF